MIQVERQGKFTEEPELNRKLVKLEAELARAIRQLDQEKTSRFRVETSSKATVEARIGELWILDTAGGAIAFTLPRVTRDDADSNIGVVRTSSANAVTTHPLGTTINNSGTHAPAANALVIYKTDGVEWWTV